MPRGGHRKGAGRKRGSKEKQTLSKELAREALRAIVLREMEAMTAAQIDAAKGIKYLVKRNKRGGEFKAVTQEMIAAGIFEDEDTVIEVWDQRPSTPAFTDLMNRALDKPAEQKLEVELSGEASLMALLEAGRKRLQE